jgi:hypothetical protein
MSNINEESQPVVYPYKYVWMDAYEGEGEWFATDYVPEDRLMTTVGYPMGETETYLAIASTYDPAGEQYACLICIPKAMIVSTHICAEVVNVSTETTYPQTTV